MLWDYIRWLLLAGRGQTWASIFSCCNVLPTWILCIVENFQGKNLHKFCSYVHNSESFLRKILGVRPTNAHTRWRRCKCFLCNILNSRNFFPAKDNIFSLCQHHAQLFRLFQPCYIIVLLSVMSIMLTNDMTVVLANSTYASEHQQPIISALWRAYAGVHTEFWGWGVNHKV